YPLVFTNDGAGVVGMLDTRIDQVVSVPLAGLAMCAKPRGVAVGDAPSNSLPIPPAGLPNRRALVACGQPDNAVLVVSVPPEQAQPIAGLPVFDSFEVSDVVRLSGSGLDNGDHIEVLDLSTGACLTFNKPVKIKKNGTVLLQRGVLSNGQSPGSLGSNLVIRFVHRD